MDILVWVVYPDKRTKHNTSFLTINPRKRPHPLSIFGMLSARKENAGGRGGEEVYKSYSIRQYLDDLKKYGYLI